MSATDDISSHVQHVTEMADVLADLGNTMSKITIMSKIICSLHPSYNSVITAWSNVHPDEQTVDALEDRLTRYEELMKRQGTTSDANHAFFSCLQQGKPLTKKEQHSKDVEYLKNLKARTKCYNCKEFGHWSADCKKPKRQRGKTDSQKTDLGFSNANVAESLRSSSDSDTTGDDADTNEYAFMVQSTASSSAFSANLYSEIWFADSSASDHMTDHREWFSDFIPIPDGTHAIQIADDTCIWVNGKGNIKILLDIDGRPVKSILQDVLYVPNLKRNLFSVGAASN